MKKDKEKKCGFCELRKKMKNKGKPVKESYSRSGDIENYLNELVFAQTKPFKLNFNEGLNVTFKNRELNEAKKMTEKQMKEKERISKGAKKKHGFEQYGERAAEVRSRTAIKLAKKLKNNKKK